MFHTTWPVPVSLGVFVMGAVITVLFGVRLSHVGDTLADRTGWGEALFGTVFFGAMISLSGIVMTATAAIENRPTLAYSNAIGGIAAQTGALGVADLMHRRANLEHAAASLSNLFAATLLIVLLSVALLSSLSPDWTVLAVHPGSALVLVVYVGGILIMRRGRDDPQWNPKLTAFTVRDEPDQNGSNRSNRSLWIEFIFAGALVAGSGWAIARAASSIVAVTSLDESLVGAVMMGIVNAIPETVVAVAAVRRGALTLAVGGVLGGNTFDVLNLVVGDVAYRGGSLYHAAGREELFLGLATVTMTAVLVGGMLRRQTHGPGNIGFETAVVLVIYAASVLILAT